MFRILIVDDEPSVVDAISQTMPWPELDVEEVFTAYSAREALAVVEGQYVDIVLTDIRMPGMDGIELMEAIRKRSGRVQFILLTGHAEFEYARDALRLHAADYLLKPVRDEALIESIRRLTTSMRETWLEVSSQRSSIQYVQDHLPTLRSDLLRNILEGRLAPEDVREKLGLLQLPFEDGDDAYPVVVRIERPHQGRHDRALLEYAVMNVAEEVIEPHCQLWTCKDVHGYLVMVLKPRTREEAGGESVSRLLSQWQHLVSHYVKMHLSIVYGACEAFPRDLPVAYEAAVRTLRRRIGRDDGLLTQAGYAAEAATVPRAASVLQTPPSISHLFSAGLWEEAKEKLLSIFMEVESLREADEAVHADVLAEIYHTVLAACYHYAHANGQTVAQALKCEHDLSFYQSPELMQSVSMLKHWAFEACLRLSTSNQEEIQDARATLIGQIQEYIHVHLAEDVSLQALAAHVDMHPVYLSKVYKLVTGEGLKEYLSRIRLERAVKLLKSSDLKIYEIAGQIGYFNTAYFIKVFKKAFGVTPQEYRDR
ncbi:response regulator [Paenibacillus antri]|uniref:Response regulator n=1 Tax=Paenibacillus antri TaxID=2582848 RepID=A0A5R9GC30_9BACL|nr:response regulator [Paenibacillus antri]TLS54027.1 response regulator [Paenibacillus antri]